MDIRDSFIICGLNDVAAHINGGQIGLVVSACPPYEMADETKLPIPHHQSDLYNFRGYWSTEVRKRTRLEFSAVLDDYEQHAATLDQIALEVTQATMTEIDRLWDKKGKILFHCVGGVDRSPCLALAWLIHKGCSIPEAIKMIHEVRPQARYGAGREFFIIPFVQYFTGQNLAEYLKIFHGIRSLSHDIADMQTAGNFNFEQVIDFFSRHGGKEIVTTTKGECWSSTSSLTVPSAEGMEMMLSHAPLYFGCTMNELVDEIVKRKLETYHSAEYAFRDLVPASP